MPEQTSPLRQRVTDDMGLRNMVALTEAAYLRAVKNFSKHFGKSPDKLTFEDMRQYRLSLVGRGLGPQAVNQIMCALQFFYKTTMGIKDAHDPIPWRGGLTRYRQFCRERRPAVFFRPLTASSTKRHSDHLRRGPADKRRDSAGWHLGPRCEKLSSRTWSFRAGWYPTAGP